jgi:hypothetical protein
MTLDSKPASQRFISADFLTPGYRIVGKMLVSSTGVIGAMNDTTTSFLEVMDAKLARVHMPTKLVDHFEVLRLVKAQVFAVCLSRRDHIGPQALARGGYARMIEYPIRVTTQVYELEGILEFTGRFDFSAIMVEGTREFIPLYNTKLTAILIPALKIESPGLLFNRGQVDLLGLLNQRAKEEKK